MQQFSVQANVGNFRRPELLCPDDVLSKVTTKRNVYRIEQAMYRTVAYASNVERRDSAEPGGDQMVLMNLR
jgi:hypothetical protein